jgi:uncharacterized integral membrane protein
MSERRQGGTWQRLRLVIAMAVLLVLMIFVLSNREPVTIGFWPTEMRWDTPLSLALLIVAVVALVAGGAIVWISEFGRCRRVRQAEAAVRLLEEQVRELKARLQQSEMPPPER